MKTPQRNFVVELKSKRRRLTTQPSSIWGNTDLKALARQVETETPHLFGTETGLTASVQYGERQADRKPQTQLDSKDETGNQKEVASSSTEAMPMDSSQIDRRVGSIAPPKIPPVKRRLPRSVTRVAKLAPGNHAGDTRDEPSERPAAIEIAAPTDDLAALDLENRRLKGLLVNQLRKQNLQLRKMLERFDVF
jgi:hypothetical protein